MIIDWEIQQIRALLIENRTAGSQGSCNYWDRGLEGICN